MIMFENVVRHFGTAGMGAYKLEVALASARESTHPFRFSVSDERGRDAVLHMSPDGARELAEAISRMLDLVGVVGDYESEGE